MARPSVIDLREAEELAAAKLPSDNVLHMPLRYAEPAMTPCLRALPLTIPCSKAADWLPRVGAAVDLSRPAVVRLNL